MTLAEYVNKLKDKRIAVIGLGISNRPLVRLLLSCGCDVTVCEKRILQDLGQEALELIQKGAKLHLGTDYLDHLDYDIVFRTPSLLPTEPHLAAAAANGSLITSEMEAFFEVCPCPIIAITGSDGKTTCSTITAKLLEKAGYTVHLGGNIGHPLLCDVPFFRSTDIAVLELSSFQLHSMTCHPLRALVTNVTPNHLDKHGTYEDYIQAKKNIYKHMTGNDTLVLFHEDALYEEMKRECACNLLDFSMEDTECSIYCRNGAIWRYDGLLSEKIVDIKDISLPGKHNVLNYMACFALTEGLVSNQICCDTAFSFDGVEHRLETVGIIRGVKYINDSIATSPTRTIAGLKSMTKKPILIAGGYDKGLDFQKLGDEICLHVDRLILTGTTAQLINDAVVNSSSYHGKPEITIIHDFDTAVRHATEISQRGDIVLLSPACASFDSFKNFEERGKRFKKIVRQVDYE